MKNVLIVAYYFPPMGMSGIQRTVKFVKYLPEYGWRPTVLTISPHAYYAFDESFLDELRDIPMEIWRTEPGGLFSFMKRRRTVSLKNEGVRKFLNRISQMVFIPDNKIGWKQQALEFLAGRDLTGFDVVYATAPPFTDHLVGVEIKRRYGLPLVVDFRDAWLEFPYHRYVTDWHYRRHRQLEERVAIHADAIVTTNEHVRSLLAGRYAEHDVAAKSRVISQGYDPADFEAPRFPHVTVDSSEVNFVYCGVFYEDRDPLMLYRALQRIAAEHRQIYRRLRFHMVGYVQEEYRNQAKTMGVDDRFRYHGYVDHAVSVQWLSAADVAWFNIGARYKGFETVSPGKAFEYLGSGKPILAILPENDIRAILSSFAHTTLVEPEDDTALALALLRLAEQKLSGRLPKPDMESVKRYDRRLLTGSLAGIFNDLAAAKARTGAHCVGSGQG